MYTMPQNPYMALDFNDNARAEFVDEDAKREAQEAAHQREVERREARRFVC